MKVLDRNPFLKNGHDDKKEKMISELNEFIEANCDYAELWRDDKVTLSANALRYRKLVKDMRLDNKIWIRTHNSEIVACRVDRR